MLYKRYKMLQKYINGEAQEEYKQGELISDVTFGTLDACNEGNQKPDEPIEGNIYQWVTISDDYVCNGKDKYTKEKEQSSSDGGKTWTDTGRTRQGSLLQANSADCYKPTVEYRWVTVEGQYECVGHNKYAIEKKQQSVDGVNWTDVVPFETQTGSLIEANSTDCGYVPPTPGGYENQYLTFEAIEDGTFTFRGKDDESFLTLSYSLDGGQTWTAEERNPESPTITTGNKIMWKGTCTPDTGNFSSTGTFKVYGNIMSIVHGDDFRNSTAMYNNHFNSLFKGTKVVNAENLVLPSTTLESYCYAQMFSGCSNLTTAPQLPATTLANNCYASMFYDCTSLTTAPQLPATTLAENCYAQMFYGCTGLVNAPALPARTLAKSCYYYMFVYCRSLVNAPALPATTLANYCYDGMFIGCTSLTTAPNLPATILAWHCYDEMFSGCTSLVNAPALPATTLADNCYETMFYGCTGLTSAPELPATTLADGCYGGMFEGCTGLVNAPTLPARTLTERCYGGMFRDCTSLTTAPALPATTLEWGCYSGMFRGCTKLTTAPELSATTLAQYCYETMFYGCTNLTSAPVLPATTLADNCYYCMFQDCSSLNYIKAMFLTTPSTLYTEGWVIGVSETGTFVKNKDATWDVTGVNGIPGGWTVQII